MSLITTTLRLSTKLLHSVENCLTELETLEELIKDDYVTLTGCDYDTSCVFAACTEKSTECNQVIDCSALNTAQDSLSVPCDIIVERS